MRGDEPGKAFGGGANDKLVARGALGEHFAALVASGQMRVEAGFPVSSIAWRTAGCGSPRFGLLRSRSWSTNSWWRPAFARSCRFLQRGPLAARSRGREPVALAPLIDPNEHSCGTVRPHGARELAQAEPGFYLAGMKSYGRAPTFLMMTGYEQVRSIAAEIAGDKDAAARVELELPETGVCTRAGVEAASRLLRRAGAG